MKQQVRIIGGTFRGKKLIVPELAGLRPTPDRVRETLFNWLMHSIRGARCLDAFAGSGALGFEACSRGATEVVLVEKSRPAYDNLQRMAEDFNQALSKSIKSQQQHQESVLKIVHADIADYLKSQPKPFDVIFLDPPFATANHLEILNLIKTLQLLKPAGLIYIEAPDTLTLDPLLWQVTKSKQAGNVFYSLLSQH